MKTSFASRFNSFAIAAVAAAGAAIMANAADTNFTANATVSTLDNPGSVTVSGSATVTVTGPVNSTGDSTSTRFNKQGAGTLVLQGDNTFKRIKHSDGTLVFDGGTTTVSGGSGTGADGNMNVLFQGDETIVTGGGSLILGSGNPYAAFRSRSMVVTNGTVDATAVTTVVLCNFKNGSLSLLDAGITTIGKDGKFRAKAMRPHQTGASTTSSTHGFRVIDGGILEITGASGLALDGAQYGMFLLDGGILLNSATAASTFFSGNWSNSPVTIGAKGAILRNGTQTALQPAVPFKSGAAMDGGLHLDGKGFVNLNADGATYNGGTYLDSNEGMLFTAKSDSSFGTVPATSTDNIFVRGSDVALFANTSLALNANRNVAISSNRTFNVVAKNSSTLTIGGEIRGARNGGALPTTTCLAALHKWTNWDATARKGWIVLNPGEVRTNDIGRILVDGNLEIKSGTTIVNGSGAGELTAALCVTNGAGSAVAGAGTLKISGGELAISPDSASKFVRVSTHGIVDVCGGRLTMDGGEYLNAVGTGSTTIRDGGLIDCVQFRVADQTENGYLAVRLATNGTLRVDTLKIDTAKTTSATFLFDGGALQPRNRWVFDAPTHAKWAGITFAVGPGGAILDASLCGNLLWTNTLVSAAAEGETDGGLTARGTIGKAVVIYNEQRFNGPVTVDGCTFQQRGGDNLLPAGTVLKLKNKGEAHFINYDAGNAHNAATLGGVVGDGVLRGSSKLDITGDIAPSIGGTIELDSTPKSLSGPIEIAGNATGCGKVKFDAAQNLTGLTLKMKNPESFDADHGEYQIVEAPNGVTGTFTLASDFPTDKWNVSYSKDGKSVSLRPVRAFTMVVR